MNDITCEYCGTSYARNNVTWASSILKCTQCGALIKVYQPHANARFVTYHGSMSSGSSFVWQEQGPQGNPLKLRGR